jgi:hypothetical protein
MNEERELHGGDSIGERMRCLLSIASPELIWWNPHTLGLFVL